MKKNILILTLTILFNFVSVLGQQRSPVLTLEGNSLRTNSYVAEIDASSNNILGSPYYEDYFAKAYVSSMDTIVDVRYNVANDEMEIKIKDFVGKINKVDSLLIKFEVSNRIYQNLSYDYNNERQKGFLMAITKNQIVNLYVKQVIKLIPFQAESISYNKITEAVQAHYKNAEPIYFLDIKKSIIEMPSKKKELLKMFPNNEKEIETFLKTNKISFKDEEDLILLVNYLDTLN